MKKITYILLVALLTCLSTPQRAGEIWLGGTTMFSGSFVKEYNYNPFSVAITPHAEFFFSNNTSLQLGVGYTYTRRDVSYLFNTLLIQETTHQAGLFLGGNRYFKLSEKLYLYAGIQGFTAYQKDIHSDRKYFLLGAYLYPGISWYLSEKLSIFCDFGILNYEFPQKKEGYSWHSQY